MTTWLITGAATGLGRAISEEVLARGDSAIVTGPHTASLQDLAERYPSTAVVAELDVTRADQREAVLSTAERLGGIDVLVNNAAVDFVGAIEEQTDADIRSQFEVNLFGALALTRVVLPGMRARRRGTIVNISSMDGIASLPGNAIYSASKFALEGLTEALWQELEPIGLRALLVEPGSFRTGIEHRTHASGEAIEDYAATGGVFRGMLGALTPEVFPGDPARAAAVIYDTVASDDGAHWLVLGSDAHRRIQAKLDAFGAEFAAGRDRAESTDFPGSGPAVL
ncbi:SDR family NAD(P)-dependent oxidoreductase [Herbiconiux sp. VKM Ac-1786]|jgi:NAD(P)-dependent dehydrogenase (short-subunit alcohol dehydrogenase family)|uniref:SDR family NAD(P)-dependent oxidoreductase n=1 Tax=Herbiconiux sp. VKM Ac-1786 TaxID=2783824 RepID=UPI00188C5F8F|nr:SDR family NAD(P)-dependent oxidoreductase [Herbiconiux sp. VKM Ac-1786]MBF4571819.1 SDR family NAD(P)-dependent oxidoreductase [Herbiconiux sp. VKM Ac-1786]